MYGCFRTYNSAIMSLNPKKVNKGSKWGQNGIFSQFLYGDPLCGGSGGVPMAWMERPSENSGGPSLHGTRFDHCKWVRMSFSDFDPNWRANLYRNPCLGLPQNKSVSPLIWVRWIEWWCFQIAPPSRLGRGVGWPQKGGWGSEGGGRKNFFFHSEQLCL